MGATASQPCSFLRLLAIQALLILLLKPVVAKPIKLEFIGEAKFETGFMFKNTEVGGLSALEYDPLTRRYYALSDDPSNINPARYYILRINFRKGRLTRRGVTFTDVITLQDKNGRPFAEDTVDPEGLRFSPRSATLYLSSEGNADRLVAPFVREYLLDGRFLREFRLPRKFRPAANQTRGIRNNQAFESLTFSPSRARLYTAAEGPLAQDAAAPTRARGAPVRILEYARRTARPRRELVYPVDPVPFPPAAPGGAADSGLVEMLAVSSRRFIMVERGFAEGVGFAVKLYLADVRGATNVARFFSIKGRRVRPVRKRLLLDLGTLGIRQDNTEAITFGPRLRDGSKTLILLSDNNFDKDQFTQFLAFKVKGL